MLDHVVELPVSDDKKVASEAAETMIEIADTVIDAVVEASEMVYEKHGDRAVNEVTRVATIAKFVFMAVDNGADDSDFQGVIAARAIDRLVQLKLAAK